MKAITEVVISLFDLVEAEGRLLRQKTLKTIAISLLMTVAAVLFLTSLVLLMAALYNFLIQYWSLPTVLLVTASAGLVLTGGVTWYVRHLSQRL
ncbi:hypothetical protein SAMN02745130_01588 [Thiothrix eikelboomii]|uniref:Holin-X, holin superfamily III n=1 Tax=Thiothrix eikelboomii TaxID=92487 RepID=A0A1T4WG26_9GAMM|nr:hypothetical protein [Thiothrix eikelboomii]SKA75855.1 hypothetical protein SAMN02745130_01588 [Thiothrix eikelboomii]